MKSKYFILFFFIVVSGVILCSILRKEPEIITEYIEGKPDTVIVNNTQIKTVRDTVFVSDTTYIDSSGYHATSGFILSSEKDTVQGTVEYNEPYFSFKDVVFKTYEIIKYITEIDTLKTTKVIEKDMPFYDNTWFWAFIVVAILFGVK